MVASSIRFSTENTKTIWPIPKNNNDRLIKILRVVHIVRHINSIGNNVSAKEIKNFDKKTVSVISKKFCIAEDDKINSFFTHEIMNFNKKHLRKIKTMKKTDVFYDIKNFKKTQLKKSAPNINKITKNENKSYTEVELLENGLKRATKMFDTEAFQDLLKKMQEKQEELTKQNDIEDQIF